MFIIFVSNICSLYMPRPKRIRKVTNPPHFKGFKPIGLSGELPPVVLNYEEYEAIRLSDYLLMGQMEAARTMHISRPTYTRIYESARRKVAEAFIEGKPIVFEGGKVFFDSEWYGCNQCGCWFNHPEKDSEVVACALCGASDIAKYTEDSAGSPHTNRCFCPHCQIEHTIYTEQNCQQAFCPRCQSPMVRRGAPHRFGNSR